MFYIVIIQSTGESLLFLAIASMANNCKTGECQKNSRQSDSFIVLKKLGNANGGRIYGGPHLWSSFFEWRIRMSNYTTQMDAARKGIITPEMERVSAYENFDVEELRELVAKGQVAIPANKNHKCLKNRFPFENKNQC